MGPVVLQVIPRLDAGGAERTAVDMAKAVADAGGRALIATAGGRLAGEAETAGARLLIGPYHSKNPILMAANARRLARLVKAHGVDILHARSRAPAWSALLAARATKTAFVVTHHGAHRRGGPLKRAYDGVMARGDRVIANSLFIAERLRADHPRIEPRLVVIPRGVDLARFDPAAVSKERIALVARYWGGGADAKDAARAFRILLPARVSAWKGHDTLVEALALWRAAGTAPRLDVVFAGDVHGRPDYFERLRGDVARRGLEDVVRFAGHVVDAPAAYLWADVVLAPSTQPEAFGRTAVEAQAMGRIVVAADHGGARETVRDGETGFLIPPGDPAALMARLDDIRRMDEARKARIVRAARENAERFSLQAMCERTLAVYDELTS